MPYKSEAQRKYFNVNRKKLEAQGVDVDEWNQSSKGKKLPEKKANTPGQTGNIPVTPPAAVRPTAAPSAHIPHLARRQTTLADAQGVKGAAAKNTATPFFYLLAKAAANYAKQANDALTPLPIPDTSNPADAPSSPLTRTDLNFDPIPPSIADVKIPSFSQLTQPKSAPKVAPASMPSSSTPSWLQRLTEFAGTPAGMATGAGLGLGGLGLGAGMYLGSRRRKDDDEKEASAISTLAKTAAESSIKHAADPTLSAKLKHYAGIPAALLGAGVLTGTGVGALAHPIQELFSTDNDTEARKKRWRERLLTGAGVGAGVGLSQVLRQISSPVQA